jgi:ketosteroid isomerase-like protein
MARTDVSTAEKGGYNGPHVVFDGGSEEDQRRLMEIHSRWLRANDILDSEQLRSMWSDSPDNVFFNSNGYTYVGLKDWLILWDYYRPRLINTAPAEWDGLKVLIRGDVAVITEAYGIKSRYWAGPAEEKPDLSAAQYIRATMVYERQQGDWMCVHAHFSPGRTGLRPEQQWPMRSA